MRILTTLITTLVILSCLYSCQKATSFEPPRASTPSTGGTGTTPTSTKAGFSITCGGIVLKGTYTAAKAVDTSNYLVVPLNIDTVGTYTISTGAVNGVSFSATGTFATKGATTITLLASGTPADGGTYNYTIGGTSGTCSQSITFLPAAGSAAYTFDCTKTVANGTYTQGVALSASNTISVSVNVTALGTYKIYTSTTNGVSFTATGSFTVLGVQTVTLAGAGTPTAAGANTYAVSANGTNCIVAITTAAPPPATFTFDGSPNTCTLAAKSGTFVINTALTSSSTVSVQVSVATTGAYSIQTQTVGGFSFSGTGTFTSTGKQNVILIGAGMPSAAGTFTFTPTSTTGIAGCSFDVVVAAAPTGVFSCSIDGIATNFGYNASATSATTGNTKVLELDGAASSTSSGGTLNLSITKIDGVAVTTGSYDQNGIFSGKYAVTGAYTDGNATTWGPTTSTTSTTQLPMLITITSITATRVKGTFSCTLGDTFGTSGKTKQLTSGVFDLPIQ
ncbi:hypothetical protein [Parasediminibacterium sp. JCM 36343]|uniref:hypothetical protein n=1 Tax=Parasediminibacterium sp. JCM 36343 TaxID=3374279 RepID=UPI00397912CF